MMGGPERRVQSTMEQTRQIMAKRKVDGIAVSSKDPVWREAAFRIAREPLEKMKAGLTTEETEQQEKAKAQLERIFTR